jgi:hypothetical protein
MFTTPISFEGVKKSEIATMQRSVTAVFVVTLVTFVIGSTVPGFARGGAPGMGRGGIGSGMGRGGIGPGIGGGVRVRQPSALQNRIPAPLPPSPQPPVINGPLSPSGLPPMGGGM